MKLQSTLITHNTTNQEEIKSVIRQLKPEITATFGEALQLEVSTLLENLGGMTDIIEANFTQIKDALQKVKEDVIKAITQEKNKEIAELKADIKAKEVHINNLKLKEGELKGKDELIANLNLNVDKL
jgi:transcription initiation factor IIF auxiliary subunit